MTCPENHKRLCLTRRQAVPCFALVVLIGATVVAVGIGWPAMSHSTPPADTTQEATRAYLQRLDIERFERQGTDFTNAVYSPDRLGKPLAEIDNVYDYDFERLQAVARSLEGVDRRTILAEIFARITRNCTTGTQQHLAVLKFLHKAGNHNSVVQPMWPDRSSVYDPLVLLELGEMRCGHVNRIAVDLYRAAGLDGRLVQVAGHVLAEVFYDGTWHYFDATFGGNGECVQDADGKIPSVGELSLTPTRVDSITVDWEPDHSNSLRASHGFAYPSWNYFSQSAYEQSGVRPSFYIKTATEEEERASIHYGWEYYRVEEDPTRKLWPDLPRRTAAEAPYVTKCEISRPSNGVASVDLAWESMGAEKFVVSASRHSRGWNFDSGSLPEQLKNLKSSNEPWQADRYEARFAEPPADVARLEVTEPMVRLELTPGAGPYFITVAALDAHGRAAGRKVFPMSEELKIAP